MTTEEFIERFAARGYYKNGAKKFIHDFWETLEDCLNEDDYVSFNGHGKFMVKTSSPQRRIHPTSGEEVFTKSRRRATFSMGTNMKKKLNQ